jgi:hypothetical protein
MRPIAPRLLAIFIGAKTKSRPARRLKNRYA